MGKITQDDLDAANASDDPIATLAARKEAKAAPKAIVTKEELAKSGLSLRDYLNKQRGLTRRDESVPGGPGRKPTGPAPSVGAGRGGRGGPTSDELDSYASSKQRAKDKAEAEWAASKRPSNAEMERDAIESSHPEAMLIGGPGIKAVAGAARALAAKTAAKAAPTAARSTSRALAETAPEELTFLGRSGARNVTPAERIATTPKRLAGPEAEEAAVTATQRLSGPTRQLPAPKPSAKAEEEVRDAVMRRKAWEEGPRGELGKNARDRIMDRDFWTRGPSAELKKGGKAKAYAKGGSVKGWGQARGARGAKIV